MNENDDIVTSLWLEKNRNEQLNAQHQTKIFQFSPTTLNIIEDFLKKSTIDWETLIKAAFSLFLHFYSSSDYIKIGMIESDPATNQTFNSIKLFLLASNINQKTSITTYLKKIIKSSQKKINDKKLTDLFYFIYFIDSQKKNITHLNSWIKNNNCFKPRMILISNKKKKTSVVISYNPFYYDKESIDIYFSHLELILLSICNNKIKKIININLLREEEENLLNQLSVNNFDSKKQLNEINYSFPNKKPTAHELFQSIAKQLPHQTAIIHGSTKISYQELDHASTHLAINLIQKNVKIGDTVAVLMNRTPQLIMTMIAILKSGGIYVPINPQYPDERIDYLLKDSNAKYVLIDNIEKLPKAHHAKALSVADTTLVAAHLKLNDLCLPTINADQVAYIIYTSGTTGHPKGVMVRHKNLVNLMLWYRYFFNINHKDRASQFASQGFDTYLCETMPFLGIGATICIIDDAIKLTPSAFFNWITENQITICDLPTAYAKILFNLKWPSTQSLRVLKIGGESLLEYPSQPFSFDIWNSYGPTEATIESTYAKIYTANTEIKKPLLHEAPPIGKIIGGGFFYIVNQYLQRVPHNMQGELLIGGAGIALGYLNQEKLTQEKFINNPFNPSSNEKLYRTGDLVKLLPDGNLAFIGRIDHQVKIRGYRIELGDIEAAIGQHPDISQVAVIIKETPEGEKSLVAYVTPNLDKERYLYQTPCLISTTNDQFVEVITEDISKNGLGLSGVTHHFNLGQPVKFQLKLPGLNESKFFTGNIIWQQNERCGIALNFNKEQKDLFEKSIDYYLSTHNIMELVLSGAIKRNLKNALRKKLPDYMIPPIIVTLLEFPLTFSGKIDKKALPNTSNSSSFFQKKIIPAKTETEKKLIQLWQHILHQENISMSDNFFDIGGDSLKAAALSVAILRDFKQLVPTKIIFDLAYIPILGEYLDSRGEKYTDQSTIQENINHDLKLNENITPTQKYLTEPESPQHILLTGAGGFLGIYLLKELLERTEAKIYCLIRQGEFDSPAKKLSSTIEKFGLSSAMSLAERRIVAISGDISFNQFGLPALQYQNLAEKIDSIYHCGAQVNIMASYLKLRGSNVQGTLEIIKFATTHVDKTIHYISTLSSACEKDSNGTLTEDFPKDHYHELVGGYAISKWVSEKVLTEIKKRGLPIFIYRSGYITGQSNTGFTNLNDALFMLIKGCIQMGYAPFMQEKITILPVDFVSRCIVDISLASKRNSMVYHLDHPTGILWQDLIAWLNNYGYNIKLISMREWQNRLVDIDTENALFPFLPYYLSLPENFQSPDVSLEHTNAMLKKVHLDYPSIDDTLLTTYFNYLCQVNFLPEPNTNKTVENVT